MNTKELAALAALIEDRTLLPDDIRNRAADAIRALTARVEACERDAERWRVARNNRNVGLRVVMYDHQAHEDMRILFPAPPQCDMEADAALNAKDVTP